MALFMSRNPILEPDVAFLMNSGSIMAFTSEQEASIWKLFSKQIIFVESDQECTPQYVNLAILIPFVFGT